MSVDRCDECGKMLKIGDWPYCNGVPDRHVPATHFGEKPMEPYTDDMISNTPVEFRTIGEKVRYMDKHNIIPSNEFRRGSSGYQPSSSEIRQSIREVFQEIRR